MQTIPIEEYYCGTLPYGGVSKPRLIESITFHESVVLCITGLQKREDIIS